MLRHTRFAFGAAQFVPRVKKPNHFLTRAWSFAVFARKLSLQALWQKRRPQWRWLTRPNFPPQFAQRLFSNLVMTLSRQRGDEFRCVGTKSSKGSEPGAKPSPRRSQPAMAPTN